MSTEHSSRVSESHVCKLPLGSAWSFLRELDFSKILPSKVESSTLSDNAHADQVGSVRVVKYKDGAVWELQLVELSDVQNCVSFEVISATPAVGFQSRIDTIRLRSVTETNDTFVEWNTEFSGKTGLDVLSDCKLKRVDDLHALSDSFACFYWNAQRVRNTFIDFFVSKGHTHYRSSPVVPKADPTLLFANAGMNQFKPIFLGNVIPGSDFDGMKSACNSQKCIRAGGKHNDLEDVGKDVYHHTFFEMLGNWSFGDYFKEEAITWAWELLTKVYKLEPDRLYATYFEGDKSENLEPDLEARDIWRRFLPDDHILTGNKKDNFWEMGATGPCGPCTEIHYDRIGGRNAALLVNGGAVNGRDKDPDFVEKDDPNVLEIWNNVFMQFNRDKSGKLTELPFKSVDTGMGFERLTSVLQNKISNYATDVFTPLFRAIYAQSKGVRYYTDKIENEDVGNIDMAYRVIADHIRTLTFAITDGALPGAKGRDSVLRRIVRRATRYGHEKLGCKLGFLSKLVDTVVQEFSGHFPELKGKVDYIKQILNEEEANFNRTLSVGSRLFEKEAAKLAEAGAATSTKFPGDIAFKLYDTFGFPYDLTELMAEERGLTVDSVAYDKCMQQQKDQSGAKAKTETLSIVLIAEHTSKLKDDGVAVTDNSAKYAWHVKPQATVQAIVRRSGSDIIFADAIPTDSTDIIGLITDKSSFYPTAGGQVCDTGFISGANGFSFEVIAANAFAGYVLHIGKAVSGSVAKGAPVVLEVDYERRALIAPNHTMTHMLNFALRKVLSNQNPPVDQRGSQNDPEKLRFDFNARKGLTPVQIQKVQDIVNKSIESALTIHTTSVEFVVAKNITSLRCMFSETYPKVVRVVTIGESAETMLKDPTSAEWQAFSVELCGGTHIDNTAKAQQFAILDESSIASGTRRIVAVTRENARRAFENLAIVQGQLDEALGVKGPQKLPALKECSRSLQNSVVPVAAKKQLEARLKKEVKKTIKEIKNFKKKAGALAMKKGQELAAASDAACVVLDIDNLDGGTANKLLDKLTKAQPDKAFIVLSNDPANNKYTCAARSGSSLDVNAIVQAVAAVGGGRAGGKPNRSQGAGKDSSKYAEAVKLAQTMSKA